MTEPVTTLDQRYSDPTATATDWTDTERALASAELFWLSTVRTDGRPHVTPVVAVWFEGAVWFSTGTREQKFANLRANPHVVLTTGANGWDGGLDVVVEGDAVHVTDEALLTRVAEAFTARWDGRWQWTVRGGCFQHGGADGDSSGDSGAETGGDSGSDSAGGAQVFRVAPAKVFAHAKGHPFGATRHLFSAPNGSENG